jgi:hypothetical protein
MDKRNLSSRESLDEIAHDATSRWWCPDQRAGFYCQAGRGIRLVRQLLPHRLLLSAGGMRLPPVPSATLLSRAALLQVNW